VEFGEEKVWKKQKKWLSFAKPLRGLWVRFAQPPGHSSNRNRYYGLYFKISVLRVFCHKRNHTKHCTIFMDPKMDGSDPLKAVAREETSMPTATITVVPGIWKKWGQSLFL
jgi:hypothetical protein